MSMITATAWVPRGFPAQFPTRHQLDEEEYDRISKLAQLQLDDAKEDLEDAANDDGQEESDGGVAVSKINGTSTRQADGEDDLKEYNLDDYDDEPEREVDREAREGEGIFGNIKALAYHENNDDDPYITLGANTDGAVSDEEEREELEVLPTDSMVLAARVEEEVAHLECYIYEDDADNLYVHHDIMLPATPLCIEWINMTSKDSGPKAEGNGNLVAVGTMDPDIELWDLDTVDSMYPKAILGAGSNPTAEKPTKKKKKKSRKPRDDYHVDAVLSLAANRQHSNLLASASADQTVKLWDINTGTCAKSYSYHSDKVCTLAWHPAEEAVMLSGGYDKMAIASDMRAFDANPRKWRVDSDVEKVAWDPHDSNYFYVSTESGILHYFDARTSGTANKPAAPVWRLQAHSASLTSFSPNPTVKGYFATGSDDKSVKLWNAQGGSDATKGPALVTSREIDVGRVFSVNFAPDEAVAFRLAVAGSKGSMKIWDTSTNRAVRAAFQSQLPNVRGGAGDSITEVNGGSGNIKERIVGLEEGVDNDESDDSEEDEEDGEDEEVEEVSGDEEEEEDDDDDEDGEDEKMVD